MLSLSELWKVEPYPGFLLLTRCHLEKDLWIGYSWSGVHFIEYFYYNLPFSTSSSHPSYFSQILKEVQSQKIK